MEKRTFLAILLCLAIVILYQMFLAPPPPQRKPAQQDTAETKAVTPPDTVEAPAPDTAAETVAAEPEELPQEIIKGEERKKIRVETDVFILEFSNVGGKLTSCKLKNYKKAVDQPDLLDLVPKTTASGITPFELYSAENKYISRLNHVMYQHSADRIDLSGPGTPETAEISFIYSDGSHFSLEKKYTFHKSRYLVDVDISISKTEDAGDIYFVWGPGLAPDRKPDKGGGFFSRRGRATNDGVFFRTKKAERLNPRNVELIETLSDYFKWLGCENNYFAALFLPPMDSEFPKPVTCMFLKTKTVSLEPGSTEESYALTAGIALAQPDNQFQVYMGPKDYQLLKSYGNHLEKIVNFGWFGSLVKILLFSLKFIYRYIGNYGVAIIILTIVINILFYPLKHKQIKSMQKMQALQPKINAIKEKYKKSKDAQARQKMNQETMNLYKKEGVNPLGGCLPMLIQLPVLYGFFSLLSVAIELRHAPFFLWIHDLSARDAYYITPLLMGASMFLLQRMTPSPSMGGSSQQAKMMKYMPLIFIFFFINFPSGLVLYWLFNNIISIIQQYFINRNLAVAQAQAKTAAGNKGKRRKSR